MSNPTKTFKLLLFLFVYDRSRSPPSRSQAIKGRSGTAPELAPSPSLSISSSAGEGLLNFRFFLGVVIAFVDRRVLFRPLRGLRASSAAGVPSFGVAVLTLSSATPFLKSETTCCSRFEAYACRFRGAYTPPAILVSKYLSSTP